MKKVYILFALIIAAVIFGGCREISVETIINSDGSFTRVITISGDSSDVIKKNLPYPIDDSWTSSFEKDSTESDKFIQKYTKNFENDIQLNKEIENDTSWWKRIKRSIDISKNSGFFYSYITYNETIDAANPFINVDYKDYLSTSDMLWLTGKRLALNSADSVLLKNAEDKAENYLKVAYTDEIIELLKEGIIEIGNPSIKVDLVEQFRDSIETKVDSWSYDSLSEFVDYFSKLTGEEEIKKINQLKASEIKKFDLGIELLYKVFEMEDYTVVVVAPGLLTNTNSPSIVGNHVKWQVGTMSFLFEDYTMMVESRVVNYWRFVLTGVILVILAIVLLAKWK